MKLAICSECRDGFFLSYERRSCHCGLTWGQYDSNGATAVIGGPAVSVALGNGSVRVAEQEMVALRESTSNTADRAAYLLNARIEYAWIRPNSGPGNPHTREGKD